MATLQVKVGADLDAPNIDIVAVHGLNITGDKMHAENTWTAANGKMWLGDFLPNMLPKARVLIFDYDANAAFNPPTQDVKSPAEKLLELLKLERENAGHRPIVFVCHSLGGLVVKQSVIGLEDCNMDQAIRSAQQCNVWFGIVFFGTPHQAGKLVALGKLVSYVIQSTAPEAASDEALEALQQDGFVAEELNEKFKERVDDFWIVSFYEDVPTKIDDGDIGKIVQERGLFSLMKDHEKTQELAGDHFSICKFESEETENWKLVEGFLVELTGNALEARRKAEILLKTRPPFAKIEDISLFCMHDDGSRKHLWGGQVA